MGLFDKLFGRGRKAAEPPPEPVRTPAPPLPPQPAEMIAAYDEFGSEVHFPRDVWRREILPTQISGAWSDADTLYRVMSIALDDGFFEELKPASKRLLEIDPIPERAIYMRSVVLQRTNSRSGAERVLREGIAKHPASAVLLTALAEIEVESVGNERAEATLWRAVMADPNYAPSLYRYLALCSTDSSVLRSRTFRPRRRDESPRGVCAGRRCGGRGEAAASHDARGAGAVARDSAPTLTSILRAHGGSAAA